MRHSGRSLIVLVLLILIWPLEPALAQENEAEVRVRNNVLTFVPQYAVSYGIRIDYERRVGSSDLWILFGPQYYADDQDNWGWSSSGMVWNNYDRMRGWGINTYAKYVAHKAGRISPLTGLPSRNLYLSIGPTYQNFTFSRYQEVAVPYEEDGITYYKFEQQEVETKLHRVGFNINFGFQFTMDNLVLDLYLGVGYKAALDENGDQYTNTFAQMIDPAYSGMIADGGFKIGFVF